MALKIAIFGATSAMAQEAAKQFTQKGASFFLVARDINKLEILQKDLLTRGASEVYIQALDLNETSTHESLIREAQKKLGNLNIALIAHGTLSNQSSCQINYMEAEKELRTNFLSHVSLLTHLANLMERQKSGTIACISSVAGDRGRGSNYIYGSAKAGLSAFLQGLRNRLYPQGVHVLTIKPGFVSTPMTTHLKQGFLFASASTAGKAIARAIQRKKNVAYVPWFWFCIMLVIKIIPENFFKKMKL